MKNTISIMFLCSLFVLVSCGAIVSGLVKDDGKQIPSYFGDTPGTLLVVKQKRKMDEKPIESAFKDYYTGSYELIERADLAKDKYSDTTHYRYYFDMKASGSTSPTGGYHGLWAFSIIDRSINKTFTSRSSQMFGTLVDAYVKELEKVRKKNGN